MEIKEQQISLFVVPGIPEDFPFETKTRKEISVSEPQLVMKYWTDPFFCRKLSGSGSLTFLPGNGTRRLQANSISSLLSLGAARPLPPTAAY
jgi:hypothetical protein